MATPLFAAWVALTGICLLSTLVCAATLPATIYGVNLGSWLVAEPWMMPQEWLAMGGERCDSCDACIASEFAFARAYPDTVDTIFEGHWDSWFNESDVQDLIDTGINTVRIPLGYWIIEGLVDRKTEYYPRGGLRHLKRGLRQLKRAGVAVILDHHALPGVQSPNQMFTGRRTNDPQFYTHYNYDRALIWTTIMTTLSHLDPDFSDVVAIQAVNEPIMDATKTPGYGQFQKDFVGVVRAVELLLGVGTYSVDRGGGKFTDFLRYQSSPTDILDTTDTIYAALATAAPILDALASEYEIDGLRVEDLNLVLAFSRRQPLLTTFMDVNWQYNHPANPHDAQMGPQLYDNHLYYSFGGVADANEEAYMTSICNLRRVEDDAALGNCPLVFGEWALPTQFKASDSFLCKWADAQKLAYSKGAGWIFWNFKIELSELANDTARQWSYMEGVRRGYLTRDPSQLHDPRVCDEYIRK